MMVRRHQELPEFGIKESCAPVRVCCDQCRTDPVLIFRVYIDIGRVKGPVTYVVVGAFKRPGMTKTRFCLPPSCVSCCPSFFQLPIVECFFLLRLAMLLSLLPKLVPDMIAFVTLVSRKAISITKDYHRAWVVRFATVAASSGPCNDKRAPERV